MTAKTITAIVISITILFVLLVTKVGAEEVTPQKKPIELKIQGWVTNEWNDIKEYQIKNWQDGKEQLARNKEQIKNLFSKIVQN
jgi:hypothetical protein